MNYKSHLELQVKTASCELQKAVSDHRQARDALSISGRHALNAGKRRSPVKSFAKITKG